MAKNQSPSNVNLNSIETDGQVNPACNPQIDNDIAITRAGKCRNNMHLLRMLS